MATSGELQNQAKKSSWRAWALGVAVVWVSAAMVDAVAAMVDDLGARFEAPANFVVPGQTPSPPGSTWPARSSAGPSARPSPPRSTGLPCSPT